jgi:hypothetical protein
MKDKHVLTPEMDWKTVPTLEMEWKTVLTLDDLLAFLVRHHHPKRLILTEDDFWRIYKLIPPSSRSMRDYDDHSAFWFPFLRTNIECPIRTPFPEFIDLSEGV